MSQIKNESLKALELYSQCFKNSLLYQEEEIRFVVIKRLSQEQHIMPDLYFNGKPKIKLDIEPNMIDTVIVSHKLEGKISSIQKMVQSYGFNNTEVKLTDLLY